MSLQFLKTLYFAQVGIDDVVGTTETGECDLIGYVGDAYLIAVVANTGSTVSIDSVVIEDNFSNQPEDAGEWAAVTGGTIERGGPSPEDVYNFHGSIVIPIDRLRRYVRAKASTTGTFDVGDHAELNLTGVALPQHKTSAAHYVTLAQV